MEFTYQAASVLGWHTRSASAFLLHRISAPIDLDLPRFSRQWPTDVELNPLPKSCSVMSIASGC